MWPPKRLTEDLLENDYYQFVYKIGLVVSVQYLTRIISYIGTEMVSSCKISSCYIYNKDNNTLPDNSVNRIHTLEYGQAAAFQDRKVVLKAHNELDPNPKPLALSV